MMALPAAIAGDVDPLSTRDLDALKPLTGPRAWERDTNGGRGRERHQQRLRQRQRESRLGSQVLLPERQLALPARHVLYLHLWHEWVSTECWVNILNDSSPLIRLASFAHLQLTPSAEAEQTICLLWMRVTLPRLNHFKFMNYFDCTLFTSYSHSLACCTFSFPPTCRCFAHLKLATKFEIILLTTFGFRLSRGLSLSFSLYLSLSFSMFVPALRNVYCFTSLLWAQFAYETETTTATSSQYRL